MGSGIARLCDGDVSRLLQNKGDLGCGNGGTGVETLWEHDGLPREYSAENQCEGGEAFILGFESVSPGDGSGCQTG